MKTTQLELLKCVVAAKIQYWDALAKLENKIAPDGEFSDSANDSVIDAIDMLAAGMPGPKGFPMLSVISEDNLRHVKKLAKL